MPDYVFDTTFIIKGLIEPRRKKIDKEYENQQRLHKRAKQYLEMVERNEIQMIIPSVALIETAAVISRLTNDEETAKDSVNFLLENANQILFDYETLDSALRIGIKTKASGFDTLFISALELSKGTLTDDMNLHRLAIKNGFKSILLREI